MNPVRHVAVRELLQALGQRFLDGDTVACARLLPRHAAGAPLRKGHGSCSASPSRRTLASVAITQHRKRTGHFADLVLALGFRGRHRCGPRAISLVATMTLPSRLRKRAASSQPITIIDLVAIAMTMMDVTASVERLAKRTDWAPRRP